MRHRSKKEKINSELKHFEKRCQQRVGESFNQKELVKMIQHQQLPVYESQSNTRTSFILTKEDKDYIIVYDKLRKIVVTIWPYSRKRAIKDGYRQIDSD